jgi:hypothetical protein
MRVTTVKNQRKWVRAGAEGTVENVRWPARGQSTREFARSWLAQLEARESERQRISFLDKRGEVLEALDDGLSKVLARSTRNRRRRREAQAAEEERIRQSGVGVDVGGGVKRGDESSVFLEPYADWFPTFGVGIHDSIDGLDVANLDFGCFDVAGKCYRVPCSWRP